MHEMSIAQSIMEMAIKEAQKVNCTKLTAITLDCGLLSGVMKEPLLLCLELLIKDTIHDGCKIEINSIPILLHCIFCGHKFESLSQNVLWQDCPQCGETFGLSIEKGKELILSRIQAEN